MTVSLFPMTEVMHKRHLLNLVTSDEFAIIPDTKLLPVVEIKELVDLTRIPTKEAAQRFRKDVAEAKKSGDLPKSLKLSVRTDYFAGGSSIDVYIKKVDMDIYNPDYDPNKMQHGNSRYSVDASGLLLKLELMMSRYNYNNSDVQTDYFDVNFYTHFGFDLEGE